MPGEKTAGNGNFWFSFNYGNVHVTSFSTEHDYCPGSEQHNWMQNDLVAARAAGIDWLMVANHRPFYSSDASEYDSHSPGCRLLKCLEDLFVQYKVDVVLTGHMHCYERTFPVINGTAIKAGVSSDGHTYVSPQAPVYIVHGTAGAMIWEKWVTPTPEWSAARSLTYGFGRMTLSNTANGGRQLVYEHKTMNSQVVDTLTIQK